MITKNPALLKRLRTDLGYTVAHWAALLHVTTRTVQRWESGKATPGGTTSAVLCGILAAMKHGVSNRRVSNALDGGIERLVYQRLTGRAKS